ncbi:hypothetical protein L873DRAFT_1009368 [Choiromyces venosus 120613-1]|uniref:Uncharacterized protein n=1 Tax=Choiromyces venosus 120613-1 TaxID=1336337 RepID=A0A3N4JYI2_9PEZI|nr:hypothetical protein L873DRAFT_1009368 [Choiromyces venosus 120613-1]
MPLWSFLRSFANSPAATCWFVTRALKLIHSVAYGISSRFLYGYQYCLQSPHISPSLIVLSLDKLLSLNKDTINILDRCI